MDKHTITLTTDFGMKDHYVASMKGVILGINPDALTVDITHEIPKYDILSAAYNVNCAYKNFPVGTIHVAVVDPGVGSARKAMAIEWGGHYFVGPDNGVFSLVLEKSDGARIVEISNTDMMLTSVSNTFHGRDIFAPAAAHLSLNVPLGKFGPNIESPVLLNISSPDVKENEVMGSVIYVDSYGNLITNISSDFIQSSSIIYIDHVEIGTISDSYDMASQGEILAIVGSSGFLEISANRASASEILQKSIRAVIRVVYS